MINERNTGQANTPTPTNMSYSYLSGPFDRLNMQSIQSTPDLYSYYPPNIYRSFGSFDEQHQWTSADLSRNVAPAPATMSYHPSMYAPSPPFDVSHNSFEYSSAPHPYSHYHHLGFNQLSNFSGSPSAGTPNFDIPWNHHSVSTQQQPISITAIQTPVAPIGSNSVANEKTSTYDQYSMNNNSRMSEMLAQRMNLIELSGHPVNPDSYQKYHRQPYENVSQTENFFSKDSTAHLQSPNNISSSSQSVPSPSSTGPKSYAHVVSSDSNNRNSTQLTEQVSNPSRQQASGYNKNFYSTQNAFSTSPNYHNSKPTVNSSDRVMNINDSSNRRQISARNKSAAKGGSTSQGVFENLTHKNQYNPKDFNLNPKGARFFVIKSYSEDDVHRSIKYNIWCSTEHGNKRLDAAFREREGKGPIYLFFSVNGSGHFCGMAEMMSAIDYEHKTDVWHMSNKWQGKFEIKWIYVKDVPNQQFRHIRLENNENKPVTNSRDTQEVPYEKGKLMLKAMHLYQEKTSIFDDFLYYESKQVEEGTTKSNIDEWH